MKNIFTQLKVEYTSLSRVEKSLADLILTDPRRFITCSMAELSRAAGVSQGSINNFANKYSDGGFAALKLRVAECVPEYEEQPFAVVESEKGVRAAMELKIREAAAAWREEQKALRRAKKEAQHATGKAGTVFEKSE